MSSRTSGKYVGALVPFNGLFEHRCDWTNRKRERSEEACVFPLLGMIGVDLADSKNGLVRAGTGVEAIIRSNRALTVINDWVRDRLTKNAMERE